MKKLELKYLKLTNFKNYGSQELELDAKLNCFLGKNGMGKTNLLDAIHYSCFGKSKFQASDRLLMLHDTDFFRLEAQFLLGEKQEEIVAKVAKRRKKALERNKVPYRKLSHHVGLFPAVFIAPDDIYLIKEGSEERRRFMDNILSQLHPAYLQTLIQYQSLLKQRNALLKSWQDNPDHALLDIYSQQIVQPAQVIHQHRTNFVKEFLPLLEAKYAQISNNQEPVSLQYFSSLNEQDLGVHLQEVREKDIILQRTTVGIHKDDLQFSIREYPLKQFGSQGQLKSFLLALKLAEYQILKEQKQIFPLLILDDIFDKLDRNRIDMLIQMIGKEDFGQIFISDTHPKRLQEIILKIGISVKNFEIVDGSANLFYL